MTPDRIRAAWRNGLVVSCQAPPESPMARPTVIAALAETAAMYGACGVRIDSPAHVRAVRAVVSLPILGIWKQAHAGSEVYITPGFDAARAVADAGADLIAIDATRRPRPGGGQADALIARIRQELDRPVVADVATLDEGLRAAGAGADYVATTLAGYTAETAGLEGPALDLVGKLAARLTVPVICEGRLRTPDDVRRAFAAGAGSVVVGGAITGIDALVRAFAAATPAFSASPPAP
jgi:N-acylglucosamine-6-phosphate 2-epimerase